MSKKKKDKFKKQIKTQILEQMARAETQTPMTSSMPSAPIVKSAQTIATDSVIQNLPQIKYDLKKTAVVIAILALMIVALVLLDQKYGLLLVFGNVLFKVLHIQ